MGSTETFGDAAKVREVRVPPAFCEGGWFGEGDCGLDGDFYRLHDVVEVVIDSGFGLDCVRCFEAC